MQYVRLGGTGLTVSRLCLGCMTYGDKGWRPWLLDESEARKHFRAAFDAGINFFDTADMYSKGRSEEVTGALLREMAPRDEYVLGSKVFFPMGPGPNMGGLSRKHILSACDASLRRLGIEYLDLYQIHRWDHKTPIEETLEALDSLVRAGKVRYLGASSMAAWQMAKALGTSDLNGWHRFVSMQDHYNLIYREEEREMIPLCLDQKLAVLPWSPLARGFLAGTRTRETPRATPRARTDEYADSMYYREEDFRVLDALLEVSAARGAKPAQVALAWLLSVPGVTAPILGATSAAHIEEAARAVEMNLTDEEILKLETPYAPHPVLGHTQPTPRGKKT
ncbi:MAG TPA: aldo/keto reductase [Candidatus Polarisedimenticolia bacterium]|nr:aldo/keto reductase [Candidatus Polarisedimenticolia bacterium]